MHYPALLLIAQWILADPIPTRLGSPPAPSYPFWPHRLVVDAASRPLKPLLSPEQGPRPVPCHKVAAERDQDHTKAGHPRHPT